MSVVNGGHVGDDVESGAKIDVTHELALIRSALTVAPFDLETSPPSLSGFAGLRS